MNILLIAIDTLRADRLSCYGYDLPTSPQIDKIAAAGVLFEEFIAPHIPTHPGFTTIMTGKDVFDHHIVTQGGAKELSEHVGISSRKIEQNIGKLKELGLLRRIGPAKGGHWEVKNES